MFARRKHLKWLSAPEKFHSENLNFIIFAKSLKTL